MPEREKIKPAPRQRRGKDCWPLYGLQNLPPGKFAVVVGKVLDGRYFLIAADSQKRLIP